MILNILYLYLYSCISFSDSGVFKNEYMYKECWRHRAIS